LYIVFGAQHLCLKIMNMKLLFIFATLFIPALLGAQVAINTNGNNPSPSALLDVSSTSKGVLISRMTSAQRKAIANPEVGLLVYDLDRQTPYLYDGERWRPLFFTSEKQLPLIEREPTYQEKDTYVNFGSDVAIQGDYAVIGARSEDVGTTQDQGVAYVYKKVNGAWVFKQKLTASNGTKASNFGMSVAIDNDFIVVGAPSADLPGKENAGAVYIFRNNGAFWTQTQMLSMNTLETNCSFGFDVAISNGKIVVGAPFQDVNGIQDMGSVFLYQQVNNVFLLTKNFISSSSKTDGHFGYSVDVFNDDVVVGFPNMSNTGVNCGAVHVYTYLPANGSWKTMILYPTDLTENMGFGYSVDIDGDNIIVGAPYWSVTLNGKTSPGLGYVQYYKKSGGNWYQNGSSNGSYTNANFGLAVAISGNYRLVGMPSYDINKGKVVGGLPGKANTYTDIENTGVLSFGKKIAISGTSFIIAAPDKNSYKGSVQFGSFE
jgi:hypothetical protein